LHIDNNAFFKNESGINFYVANSENPYFNTSTSLAQKLIDEFSVNYALPVSSAVKQRSAGMWILNGVEVPSVIIETGYFSNEKDARYLQTAAAKETIAKNILAAINKFKAANLQSAAVADNNILDTINLKNGIYINTNHADTNYFKTDYFKTKALVFTDGNEVGNVGIKYVEKSNAHYNSLVTYNPEEGKKLHGEKGKYGVIKLTIKDAAFTSAKTVFFDEQNNLIKFSGNKTIIDGDLSKVLIYIDGKISAPADLNKIIPNKISDIAILKGNKLDDIIDAKGKTALIDVALKADDLPEVVVPVKIKTPLYIINGKESTKEDFDKIAKERITDIREIKKSIALQVYGDKGKNGVIIINCNPETSGPYADKMIAIGDISKIGAKPYFEVDGKEYPGNSLPQFMKETGIEHFELITLYTKEDAVKKFGDKATDGAIIATTKK
jgi:N-acetylmuramoyl-L-alanine amidase